jgi:HSP20 family protein
MNKVTFRRPSTLFGEFFNDDLPNRMRRAFDGDPLLEPVGWMPPVEIEEKADELVLSMELPGLTRDQVDVSFDDGVLTIRGEKSEEREEGKDRKLHVWERRYGAFHRSFTLPRNLDVQRIGAEFAKGVLRVRMPKAAEEKVKGRKIEVAGHG